MAEAKEAPAPKLSEKQSTAALREHIQRLQGQLALGSKSDIDQIGARLQEILDWMDAIEDNKRPNPASVRDL